MKKILIGLSYVPFIYLVYIYAGHGLVEGLMQRTEFFDVISVLGLGSVLTMALVILTGLLDTTVAILLVAKDKVAPQLPWLYLYLWVGLWPWVPRVLELYGGMDLETEDAVIVSIMALLAYGIHRKFHTHSSQG